MNNRETAKNAGIVTIVTVFISMLLLASLFFSQNSMIFCCCLPVVFFVLNFVELKMTRNTVRKKRLFLLGGSNGIVAVAAVLLLNFVF